MIETLFVPVGQASEEGIEAQNKTIRYVREHHTRKVSRVKSNTDLMNWLLQSSSPNIAQYRTRKPDRKRKELLPEAQDLFFTYTYETETSSSDEGEDDSSSSDESTDDSSSDECADDQGSSNDSSSEEDEV